MMFVKCFYNSNRSHRFVAVTQVDFTEPIFSLSYLSFTLLVSFYPFYLSLSFPFSNAPLTLDRAVLGLVVSTADTIDVYHGYSSHLYITISKRRCLGSVGRA